MKLIRRLTQSGIRRLALQSVGESLTQSGVRRLALQSVGESLTQSGIRRLARDGRIWNTHLYFLCNLRCWMQGCRILQCTLHNHVRTASNSVQCIDRSHSRQSPHHLPNPHPVFQPSPTSGWMTTIYAFLNLFLSYYIRELPNQSYRTHYPSTVSHFYPALVRMSHPRISFAGDSFPFS